MALPLQDLPYGYSVQTTDYHTHVCIVLHNPHGILCKVVCLYLSYVHTDSPCVFVDKNGRAEIGPEKLEWHEWLVCIVIRIETKISLSLLCNVTKVAELFKIIKDFYFYFCICICIRICFLHFAFCILHFAFRRQAKRFEPRLNSKEFLKIRISGEVDTGSDKR